MAATLKQPSSALSRVLFVTTADRKTDGSRVYRCDYQAKQLAQADISSDVVYWRETTASMVDAADLLIVCRCSWNTSLVDLIRRARRAGKVVCGDLDDKIFAPWDVQETGFLRSREGVKRDAAMRSGMAANERNILRLLPMFDVVLSSTPGIRDELDDLGIRAHVMRNAFDTDVVRPIRRERSGLRRLLIMTGTATHDADLRAIAHPLGQFLYENPGIECSMLGPFELPGPLCGLHNVKRQDLLPLNRLFEFVSQHDLCLVPLEKSTFNDCKSALKFIEAGLVSVPVLASPRREFRELVRHGENGFLAGDDHESWYRGLCRLRDQPALLRELAAQAHASVTSQHTVASRGTVLADYLKTLSPRPVA